MVKNKIKKISKIINIISVIFINAYLIMLSTEIKDGVPILIAILFTILNTEMIIARDVINLQKEEIKTIYNKTTESKVDLMYSFSKERSELIEKIKKQELIIRLKNAEIKRLKNRINKGE